MKICKKHQTFEAIR